MARKNELDQAALQKQLKQGEQVLWSGEAASFGLLEAADGKKELKKIVTALVVVPTLLLAYVNITPKISTGIISLTLLILAAILLSPLLTYRTLSRRQYLITNRRVLVFLGDWMQADMELAAADKVAVYNMKNGVDSVVLGSKIMQEGNRQLRWRSAHPLSDDMGHSTGLVLYGIPRADEVVSLLESLSEEKAA